MLDSTSHSACGTYTYMKVGGTPVACETVERCAQIPQATSFNAQVNSSALHAVPAPQRRTCMDLRLLWDIAVWPNVGLNETE